MGFVRAVTIHIPENGMVAGAAAYTTDSSGAGMAPSRMWGGTPSA